jgi:hypothetical protein
MTKRNNVVYSFAASCAPLWWWNVQISCTTHTAIIQAGRAATETPERLTPYEDATRSQRPNDALRVSLSSTPSLPITPSVSAPSNLPASQPTPALTPTPPPPLPLAEKNPRLPRLSRRVPRPPCRPKERRIRDPLPPRPNRGIANLPQTS